MILDMGKDDYRKLGWSVFERRFHAVRVSCDADDLQDIRQIIELSWVRAGGCKDVAMGDSGPESGPDVCREFLRCLGRELYLFAKSKGFHKQSGAGFDRIEIRLDESRLD